MSDLHTNGTANCAPTGAQDDMVEVLRAMYKPLSPPWFASNLIEAQQDEIERLRGALALAVGELSTHAQYAVYSPDQLLEQFMQETRRGAD